MRLQSGFRARARLASLKNQICPVFSVCLLRIPRVRLAQVPSKQPFRKRCQTAKCITTVVVSEECFSKRRGRSGRLQSLLLPSRPDSACPPRGAIRLDVASATAAAQVARVERNQWQPQQHPNRKHMLLLLLLLANSAGRGDCHWWCPTRRRTFKQIDLQSNVDSATAAAAPAKLHSIWVLT